MIAYIALGISIFDLLLWIALAIALKKVGKVVAPMLKGMAQMAQVSHPVILDGERDL